MPPEPKTSRTAEQDREADYFAMHLLIPDKLLKAYMKRNFPNGLDLGEDDIQKVAKAFAAPDVIAAIRLTECGYLKVTNAP